MSAWQLQKAKARLSEMIKKAADEGPQSITVHGEPAAIVMSAKDYRRLKRRESFVAFMRRSPLYGVELSLERRQTPTRKVEVA